jgi:hypothetical protein
MYFPMLLRTRKEKTTSHQKKEKHVQDFFVQQTPGKMQYYSVLQGNQTFKVTLCLKPGGHTFEI